MKILIADDEMISRVTIQRMIKNYCPWAEGVEEVSSGRQAVEKAKEMDADVVLMDIEMPEMNGLEASRLIKEWKEDCIIIFLTAYATFQYAKQAISLGAAEFLVKPVEPEELKAVLERGRNRIHHRAGEGLHLREDVQELIPGGESTLPVAEDMKACGGRAGKIIQEGKLYMDLHYMDDIGVDTMARMYQVSPNYFNKMFKQTYNVSCKEYLINIRVKHAMEYLENPALTIREAGIMAGYEDSNYFTRIFKKKTGMTPLEYRNKCFFQPKV